MTATQFAEMYDNEDLALAVAASVNVIDALSRSAATLFRLRHPTAPAVGFILSPLRGSSQ